MQDIRHDFIRNEVSNFSLGKHLYAYTLGNEYAARVQDMHSYHGVSRDVVTRWTYPLVPDVLKGGAYSLHPRCIYKEHGTGTLRIARNASINEGVVIGGGAQIGDNVSLTRCTLARNVSIQRNTCVTDSYLWEDVQVGEGCVVEGSVLAQGCVLGDGVRLAQG
ncbi:hypothetical protein EON64_11330, partial [archaeon]